MLEHLQLHLLQRRNGERGLVLFDVVEPFSKAPLGTVRLVRRGRWRLWPRTTCLNVYEVEDDPLLFSVKSLWTWPRAWEIRDADEAPVGRLQRGTIISWRSPIPEIFISTQDNGLLFLSSQGNQLGTTANEREGCRLSFSESLSEDPFTKMLLLGGTLAWKIGAGAV
jgi:hypothetical protein